MVGLNMVCFEIILDRNECLYTYIYIYFIKNFAYPNLLINDIYNGYPKFFNTDNIRFQVLDSKGSLMSDHLSIKNSTKDVIVLSPINGYITIT